MTESFLMQSITELAAYQSCKMFNNCVKKQLTEKKRKKGKVNKKYSTVIAVVPNGSPLGLKFSTLLTSLFITSRNCNTCQSRELTKLC